MHLPFLQACRGKNEEFKLCNINRCIKGSRSICIKVFAPYEVEMFGRNSARASSTWRQPGEPKRIMPRNLILKAIFHFHSCCLRITYEINIKNISYNSWAKSAKISEGTNLKEEELRQQNGFPTKLCMVQTTITTSDG